MRNGTNMVNVLIINLKMKPSKNKILHLPILIEQDEDNVYIVSCPVFKGCHSYGKTVDDALVNIREVIDICMDEAILFLNIKTKISQKGFCVK
jgi:predicted RNase H-like HicB family nuclease